jgi:peptide deformylase
MINEVLLLGNPKLYEISQPVAQAELGGLKEVVNDLHDTLMDFKQKYGAGRAIAAPQIGVMKRLLYMYINRPVVFINPELRDMSTEMMVVWDDCMCFPELLVKVERHKTCTIAFRDMDWKRQEMFLEGDLSELLQHEYDHLDGILAVSRAMDEQSFAMRSQKNLL